MEATSYLKTFLLTFSALVLFSCQSTPKKQMTLTDSEAIYDYAYPLVIMKLSQDLMLTSPFRPPSHPNKLLNYKQLAQPKNTAVVLGNRNTLYCVGWIDLLKGPVLFEIPDMKERYYVMPLLDAWTNTFISLGSRTTGQKAQKYFLVNKYWAGNVPNGYKKVICPTDMVWLTGRIQADSEEDAILAAALQSQLVLTTYEEATNGTDPFSNYVPMYEAKKVRKPVPYSLKMSAEEFYNVFFTQWRKNVSPSADQPFLEKMKAFGLTNQTESFNKLNPSIQQMLSEGLMNKQKTYLEQFYEGSKQTSPWTFNRKAMGTWGIDYTERAYWAMWGLGANIVEDAVYGVSQLDERLKQLNGNNIYTIHFEPNETPPVGGFWSITAYNKEGYLEDNDLKRYASGNNMNLEYNADGSLDMYLSNQRPIGVPEYNWIPCPKENFKILFRMYWPDEEILNGDWQIPNIKLQQIKN